MKLFPLIARAAAVAGAPIVKTADDGVQFIGINRNGVEVFLGIPYGQDTGGENRFKPPQPFVPEPGTVIDATKPGLACPQQLGQWNAPLTLLNVTEGSTSEDCLNLNIARPKLSANETNPSGMPVMVWIHGGSFWVGSNMEPTHQPDALVMKSYEAREPIIHVAMNYRLGLFGFAQSDSLKEEYSENAGLRDQRLAIEWVRDHIHSFGGNPNRITIFGQSSGGLAVGMQVLAYGGEGGLPFQQAICESQALEPGITGKYTIDAMQRVVDYVGCNPTNGSIHAPEIISCLRQKDTQCLFDASAATLLADAAHNIGDIWLPAVDGDFLPDAPSKLIAEGLFHDATMMMGWTEDDTNPFANFSIANAMDTYHFITSYLPSMPPETLTGWDGSVLGLLKLYPETDFNPPEGTNLTANFYRSARMLRDALMVCQPLYLAQAMHKYGNGVYLYNWNQTLLDPILAPVWNISKLGVVHTSEFAYIYANFSHYNTSDWPFNPTQSDYDLLNRASKTWIDFANYGTTEDINEKPGVLPGLAGWKHAFWRPDDVAAPPKPGYPYIMTIGGPWEGLNPLGGPDSLPEISEQKLVERCGFFNDPAIIPYLDY